LHVQKNEMGPELGVALQRLASRGARPHVDLLVFQHLRQRLADALLVIDDQDAPAHGSLRFRRYRTTAVGWMRTSANPGETRSGTAPVVSAPATGGSLVECTPNTCAAWRMIGSRNHHAASAATRATARIASRNSPLRQPFTVSHVIHRTSGLERALHQIERAHERRLGELESAERLLEPGEGGGPGVARRAPERDVGAERPRFRGKPERREFLLHTVL